MPSSGWICRTSQLGPICVTSVPWKTESGARTMTVDPKTHKIYRSVGQRNGPANNFKVLVYEMQK